MPLPSNRLAALCLWIFVTLACSACHSKNPGVGTGNCQANERVYFSCPVGKQRHVSLCGSPGADKQNVYYRLGGKNSIELEHPDNSENDGGFFYNDYRRPRAEYTEVTFQRDGYRYKLFRYYDVDLDEDPRYGVAVAENLKGSEAITPCTSEPIDNLSDLSAVLSCNQESALGCSE